MAYVSINSTNKVAVKNIKKALNNEYPGIQFRCDLENPNREGTDTHRRVLITYNADLAAEVGFSQKRAREIAKDVISRSSDVTVETIAFNPKKSAMKVNNNTVHQLINALAGTLCNSAMETEDAVMVLEAIAPHLSRQDKMNLDEALRRVKEQL